MIFASALFGLVLAPPASGASGAEAEEQAYGASVTFQGGRCRFWTGDNMFKVNEFQADLETRFDKNRRIIIYYPPDTPDRCVQLARRAAKRAGFQRIVVEVRRHAGALLPPIGGS